MEQISPKAIWHMDDEQLSRTLEGRLLLPRAKEIYFCIPGFMYYRTSHHHSSPTDFPTISVTGKGCALNCRHCGGQVLETMYPVTSSEELFNLCAKLRKEGALGCLVSGGCSANGSVPLERFLDGIVRIKKELGLTVLVHTGIIDKSKAKALAEAGVDSALIDIIGSNVTIREICRLNLTVDDYARSLRALHESGMPFVPHVIVGLHNGRLKGEFHALQMMREYKLSALVVIAFMPIHGTEMEKVEPPVPLAIARVLAVARTMFPHTPLALGCMRPKGGHRAETDTMAIKAGVDAIAFPEESAIRFAQSRGRKLVFSSFCCSQVYAGLMKSPAGLHEPEAKKAR